jgi:hypothetical protein
MQTKALLVALFAAVTVSAVAMPKSNKLRDITARQADDAADFGDCDPTIDFQLGREGRDADEGTFLPVDPLVAEGQQDALNPNIITVSTRLKSFFGWRKGTTRLIRFGSRTASATS